MNLASTDDKGIKWHCCNKIEDLKSYHQYWQECFISTENSFFYSPNWLIQWKNTFWDDNWSLHLYIAFNNDECVLYAPFYIKKSKHFPYIKTLSLFGQGEDELFEISSEYQDVFVQKNHSYLLNELNQKLTTLDCDNIKFNALLDSAHILKLLPNMEKSYIKNVGTRYVYSSKTDQVPQLSKNNRSKLNKCKNKLTALNASFIWVKKEDFATYWGLMKQFHQTRWSKLGKTGAFCHDEFSEFHNDFRENNQEDIKISAVLVNNKPIAIHYYFASNDTLYFYQSGWDEENYAIVSPGFALHIWSMNNCPETFYDLMMGSIHNSYKAKLGCNHNSKMYNVVLVRNKLKHVLAKLINKLKK